MLDIAVAPAGTMSDALETITRVETRVGQLHLSVEALTVLNEMNSGLTVHTSDNGIGKVVELIRHTDKTVKSMLKHQDSLVNDMKETKVQQNNWNERFLYHVIKLTTHVSKINEVIKAKEAEEREKNGGSGGGASWLFSSAKPKEADPNEGKATLVWIRLCVGLFLC